MTNGRVLLGITGCIAAYKSCEVLRGLQKAGRDVRVVMTEAATRFIAPTTFGALTNAPVGVGLFDDPREPIPHIRFAEDCDLFLIAPCTADVLAKMANGIADDLLTSTALAAWDKLVVAPAMNVHMYESPATQHNMALLRERGVRFIEPDSGRLACGDVGTGKLAPVGIIVDETLRFLGDAGCSRDLEGMRVLVTAGPTIEPIDPVRYISNPSTGKMGYAIAQEALHRGAEVTLVSGPVAIPSPAGASVVSVRTADEMLEACERAFDDCDIAIFSAAVSDMKPATVSDHKLKKGIDDDALGSIELIENPDILSTLAARKKSDQVVVGFAAETDDVVANGKRKLASKHADLIVANDVSAGKGFASDRDRVVLLTERCEEELPEMTKREIGKAIFDFILKSPSELG